MTATLNIRLSGGKHLFEGRVEQYYAGTWGTVCDDGWDMNDAKVVCRQLGLGEAVKAVGCALFGQGRGYTMLSNVDCIGHESALGWCLHPGWRSRSCSHYKDANVICKGRIYRCNILKLTCQLNSYCTLLWCIQWHALWEYMYAGSFICTQDKGCYFCSLWIIYNIISHL